MWLSKAEDPEGFARVSADTLAFFPNQGENNTNRIKFTLPPDGQKLLHVALKATATLTGMTAPFASLLMVPLISSAHLSVLSTYQFCP